MGELSQVLQDEDDWIFLSSSSLWQAPYYQYQPLPLVSRCLQLTSLLTWTLQSHWPPWKVHCSIDSHGKLERKRKEKAKINLRGRNKLRRRMIRKRIKPKRVKVEKE